VKSFGTEFNILLEMSEEELKENLPERIAKGVMNVRNGSVDIVPGYDGEYGKVRIFREGDSAKDKQLSFF